MARAFLALIATLLFAPLVHAAADDIKVCDVIPKADVEGTTGAKLPNTEPGYRVCSWRTPVDPTLWASIKAFKRAGQKVSGTAVLEQMKKMGFKGEVLDDKPDLWCARQVAPESAGGAVLIDCHALTKGHYFEVQLSGAGMTPEKAKALVAKVAARLP